MDILLERHLRLVSSPANLTINDQIRRFRAFCREHGCARPYHHFAFGQSPFSPPPPVVEALKANAAQHDYLPAAGLPELRTVVADFYGRVFGLHCNADQVVVGPGSKELIAVALAVLDGPVVIPTPSWVSYLPQARILRKEVLPVRTRREDGFKLTPRGLDACLRTTAARQKILILNHPHNPTGCVYSGAELSALAEVCRAHGVVVISDEIYALTTFDQDSFVSMGRVFPEGTIVTGGLSKDRSCGGYRLGVAVFPSMPKGLIEDVLKVAGSTYSCVSAPIQFAALTAYSNEPEVTAYIRDCTLVNAAVGRAMGEMVGAIEGLQTQAARGAFYLFVDFNEYREQFNRIGITTCGAFTENLLKVEHTALLSGAALLLPEDDFSVRCSFVDYDGDQALSRWRRDPPATTAEERSFVLEVAPLVTDGVGYIARYLEQIRSGETPRHQAS